MALGLIRRADVILTDFSPARAGEADRLHPAVIVSNNKVNAAHFVFVVVPMTSNLERLYEFDLLLPAHRTELNKDSKAQINLIRHVSDTRLRKRLGFVPDDLMLELDERILEHLGLLYRFGATLS
jgi:mRNA interferase MazF